MTKENSMSMPTVPERVLISQLKVLVVDDFSTMRRIICGLLKEMGFLPTNTVQAEDGAEALILLHQAVAVKAPFDLVIADVNMPNVNGFKLLEEIKKNSSLKEIPVLMVTAEARKEDIVGAAQMGAAGYIVKPFTAVTLTERVTKIFQKLSIVLVPSV